MKKFVVPITVIGPAILAILAVLVLAAAACGGGNEKPPLTPDDVDHPLPLGDDAQDAAPPTTPASQAPDAG